MQGGYKYDFGLSLIQNGFAEENGYGTKYDRQERYRVSMNNAIQNETGMWGVCDYDGEIK